MAPYADRCQCVSVAYPHIIRLFPTLITRMINLDAIARDLWRSRKGSRPKPPAVFLPGCGHEETGTGQHSSFRPAGGSFAERPEGWRVARLHAFPIRPAFSRACGPGPFRRTGQRADPTCPAVYSRGRSQGLGDGLIAVDGSAISSLEQYPTRSIRPGQPGRCVRPWPNASRRMERQAAWTGTVQLGRKPLQWRPASRRDEDRHDHGATTGTGIGPPLHRVSVS